MDSSERFEIWLAKNEDKLSTLVNPELAIVQRSAEILCIHDLDEVRQKISHHLENLQRIMLSYASLHEPLTPEGKRLHGNERIRIKVVRSFPDHVKTRLAPILLRSDVFDPSGTLGSDFNNLVREFQRKLDCINDISRRNQDRWPLCLNEYVKFTLRLSEIIRRIEEGI